MKAYLFDAFPLLCWLQEEPGWEMVDRPLREAEEKEAGYRSTSSTWERCITDPAGWQG